MLIKTQKGTYCNTAHVAEFQVKDIMLDANTWTYDIVASMANGKECTLGSYRKRRLAEIELETMIKTYQQATQERIYKVPANN